VGGGDLLHTSLGCFSRVKLKSRSSFSWRIYAIFNSAPSLHIILILSLSPFPPPPSLLVPSGKHMVTWSQSSQHDYLSYLLPVVRWAAGGFSMVLHCCIIPPLVGGRGGGGGQLCLNKYRCQQVRSYMMYCKWYFKCRSYIRSIVLLVNALQSWAPLDRIT
jgi:hypothetical protein